MTRHRLAVELLLGLASLLTGSCGQPRHLRQPQAGGPVELRPVSSEPVIATVNGSPLLASDLVLQRRAGQTPGQALRELIQAELLVQEAARRGLDRHPRVLAAQRRAMAELLVRRSFRDELGPAQIPRRLVEQAYQKNLRRFRHPELVDVSHILASATKKDPPAVHQAARRLAERARALAIARPLTPEAFLAIEKQLAPQAGAVRLRAETLTTPLRGYTVAPFADAAFALTRPGAVSPVVATSFGYHVIYLRQRIPASNVTLEQAEPEIRQRILEEARTTLLGEFIAKLEKEHRVRLMPENMDRVRSEAKP